MKRRIVDGKVCYSLRKLIDFIAKKNAKHEANPYAYAEMLLNFLIYQGCAEITKNLSNGIEYISFDSDKYPTDEEVDKCFPAYQQEIMKILRIGCCGTS